MLADSFLFISRVAASKNHTFFNHFLCLTITHYRESSHIFARCPFLTSRSIFGHIWPSGGLMRTIGENNILLIYFRVMQWKPEHDAIFFREILASDLYSTHKGSSERGKIWSQLAEKLNEVSSCKFIVRQKSLRDRLKLLTQKHKQKMRSEERASGIDPEITEINIMLEEVCEKEEVAEEEDETKRKKPRQKRRVQRK